MDKKIGVRKRATGHGGQEHIGKSSATPSGTPKVGVKKGDSGGPTGPAIRMNQDTQFGLGPAIFSDGKCSDLTIGSPDFKSEWP